MASAAVRDAFRAAWPVFAAALPYFETVNVEPDAAGLPDLWGTLAFEDSDDAPATTSDRYRDETGTVSIGILARSGTGDAAAIAAAAAIHAALADWSDPTGTIVVETVDPPREVNTESRGAWFILSVDADFRRLYEVAP